MSENRIINSNLRMFVQLGFIISSVLLAIHFHRFVAYVMHPDTASAIPRPAAVDAWLPISSFMSLVHFVKSGVVNTVHPAGLVLFSLILIASLTIRRGFCSWICPIGTASEYGHKIGRRVMGQNLNMHRWLDIGLRMIKYVLLGFFVIVICRMPEDGLRAFIYGPYNRIADIKMYMMFAHISLTTIVVILVLTILSILFKNFWCRYLCPYGALLGLASMVSPVAVSRDANSCIDCGKCTTACPNSIKVHRLSNVRSAECTACYSCVEACPQSGALRMGLPGTKQPLSLLFYGIITVALFVTVPQAFRALGYWDSDTSIHSYRHLYENIINIDHERFRRIGK